jgi:hypothetical protein
MNPGPYLYNPVLNEIHTTFPALLYETERFNTLPSVFEYVQSQISNRYDVFSAWQRHYSTVNPTANVRHTVPVNNRNRERNRRRRQNRARNRIARNESLQNNQNIVGQNPNTNTNPNDPAYVVPAYSQNHTTGILEILEQLLPANDLVYTVTVPRRTTTSRFSDPVIVRPTPAQIDAGSTLRTSLGLIDLSCAVCQHSVTEGEIVRCLLPCNHQYHRDCIDTWFQRNVHCPVCRHDIREQA